MIGKKGKSNHPLDDWIICDQMNMQNLSVNEKRYIEIGYNIQYYRKHKGLTQEQLAELLDISRQHLGAIEAPKLVRAVSLDLLFRIADILEIDVRLLLDFHGNG